MQSYLVVLYMHYSFMLIGQVFIKMIGRVLCFGERLKHLKEVKNVSKRKAEPNRTPNNYYQTLSDIEAGNAAHAQSVHTPQSYPGQIETNETNIQSDEVLSQIHSKLHRLESRLERQAQPGTGLDMSLPADVRVEWRTLAMVLDRLFCITFLVVDFVSLALFHPK